MRLASGIYEGVVSHRRWKPVEHSFRYRQALVYLDLDELDHAFTGARFWSPRRPAPAWFRRADYLAPHDRTLAEAARDRVEAETGRRPLGPVRLLTHVRTWGYVFNPVSFYYCFDRVGDPPREQLFAILAEITNTPWNERFAYVVACGDGAWDPNRVFAFPKRFHVSPFMPMDVSYAWSFGEPGETLRVDMRNLRRGEPFFSARLSLERREMTGRALDRLLFRHPLMTLRVIGAIHLEAARLWSKHSPVHPHPRDAAPRPEVPPSSPPVDESTRSERSSSPSSIESRRAS